ncbi:hypothetical protein KAJ27_12550 [bacterium]|nr:hypothetical protein [bacterium]
MNVRINSSTFFYKSMFLMITLMSILFLSGCLEKGNQTPLSPSDVLRSEGSLAVEIKFSSPVQAKLPDDLKTLIIKVTGSDMDTISVEYDASDYPSGATLTNIKAGTGRNVTATGVDDSGNDKYTGNASVDICNDQTASLLVNVYLIDDGPSNCSVTINNDSGNTETLNVNLYPVATNATHMMFSNDSTFSANSGWIEYDDSSSYPWTLASGDEGTRIIYAKYRSSGDIESSLVQDNITYIPSSDFFVDSVSGNNTNDGRSWSSAKKTIQNAIDSAPYGGTVLVKAGTYVEAITLKDGVAMYGGCDGTETSSDDRTNIFSAAKLTVIDGNNSVNHVVTGTSGAYINGFQIKRGNAVGIGELKKGAGLYASNSNGIQIIRCWFESNTSIGPGTGLYFKDSINTSVDMCLFKNNTGTNDGTSWGTGLCFDNSGGSITSSIFHSNKGSRGTAMAIINGSSPLIANNTIHNNEDMWESLCDGIYCNGAGSDPRIYNCIVYGNSLGGNGSIISENGSAITVDYSNVDGGWFGQGGAGNLSEDPKFINNAADPDGPDDEYGTDDDEYRLDVSTSNCHDSGSGDYYGITDFTGAYRNDLLTVDMGAYEQ